MPREPLPLGSYGTIRVRPVGDGFLARTLFRDFDGVVRQVRRQAKTKTAAQNALKKALAERQTPFKGARLTRDSPFSAAAEVWMEGLIKKEIEEERSSETLRVYGSVYKNHVAPALDAVRLREVTTPLVDQILSAIKAKSVGNAKLSKTVIASVMKVAIRHGAIENNPVRETDRIETKRKKKRKPKTLNAQQREVWLSALDASPRARDWDLPDLTRLMLATGVRIGEVLAIGWDEVDLDAATVNVTWHIVRKTGAGLQRRPSTKSGESGERLLPLPLWAVEILHRRRALIKDGVQPVFPDSLGGWRDPSNVQRVWREVRADLPEAASEVLNVDDLVTHLLRKTVASHLDDAKVQRRKISDQLGHARLSMTEDYYIARGLTDRETADALEDLFDDQDG
ncbi:site-specific integrase [Kineosporia mesophila]|uniref:Site-specific integrase n=1 Tax=Kineosporia mesophila TaxID=566012 RepID=A0ABP7A4G9_9ACTN|nr:site-specific integrase [Kineosporia mesophila]MCD5353826.1 site-specific integrase [Kineosporia mesophila]